MWAGGQRVSEQDLQRRGVLAIVLRLQCKGECVTYSRGVHVGGGGVGGGGGEDGAKPLLAIPL